MQKSFVRTSKQTEALDVLGGPAKHIMLFGGSRSGKTFQLVEAICARSIVAAESRHSILRFRFSHIKSSIVMDTFPKVMRLCFPGVGYEINKSDWFAEFSNGSQIWFGGLDDKERTEKILGNEFSTIYLNECSQIPYGSRNLALTRLAQKVYFDDGKEKTLLPLKMYYDCNPPSKMHWTYKLFIKGVDPDNTDSINRGNYDCLLMNPEDNIENLTQDYVDELDSLPARLRLRFKSGKFGEVNENALWQVDIIDKWRSSEMPEFTRIVVAVDPSGASSEDCDNDAIGIVVCALGVDGNAYLLEDLTKRTSPAVWGKIATSAYDRHRADCVVGEANYGGAMVEHVIQTARPGTPFKSVSATRGKVVRAEPIAALHEAGKLRFAGHFDRLEDELLSFTTTGYTGEHSPNRADAFIWAMSELFPGVVSETTQGFFKKIQPDLSFVR